MSETTIYNRNPFLAEDSLTETLCLALDGLGLFDLALGDKSTTDPVELGYSQREVLCHVLDGIRDSIGYVLEAVQELEAQREKAA